MQLVALAAKDFPTSPNPDGDGEAAVPDEVVAIDRLTFASWGGGLSLPQYLARERRLRACAYSKGLVQWVLREGSELLASCETYAVPFVHSAPDGTRLREGLGHGVASVFVEDRLRGKGYASIMLQRIHERLRGEGALCMYLMSEIGPTLYERLGYVARPLRICRFAAADPAREAPRPPTWRWLTEAEVPSLLLRQARDLFGRARTGLWIDTPLAQLDWHLQRGHFYARILGRKRAVHVGAEAGASVALWQPDYRRGVLNMILLWPGSTPFQRGLLDPRDTLAHDFRSVQQAARVAAWDLGLANVEIWETPRSATYLRGGARGEAKELPMILPLVPGIQADEWTDYERAHWI
jgi:GNAT superfamily N-acetyltransferase